MSEDGIMVCKTAFQFQGRTVRRGDTVRVGHPALEGNGIFFRPFRVTFEHEPPATSKHSARPKPEPKPEPEAAPVQFEDPPEE